MLPATKRQFYPNGRQFLQILRFRGKHRKKLLQRYIPLES